MGVLFAAASSQYLISAAPVVVAQPFSVGMWLNLTAVDAVNRTLWALSASSVDTHYWILRMSTTEQLTMIARDGGTENSATATGALIAGTWNFVVIRVLSNTNRRISVILSDGTVTHGSTTTTRAPAGIDTMTIGALSTLSGVTEPWDGIVAEYWFANSDVGIDGSSNLTSELLWHLAYGGPFSMQHIADNIIEYRSMRKHPSSDGDDANEIAYGPKGRQIWENTNSATITHHPPLPGWYIKPGQNKRILAF